MRQYVVPRIDGLPPKKDGAKSMWNKPVEFGRLVNLRQAVRQQMHGDPPLREGIHLSLMVHTKSVGDLDNYITGICDSLMATRCGKRSLCSMWERTDLADVHPSHRIAIEDDGAIVSIEASKVVDEGASWYSVELKGA